MLHVATYLRPSTLHGVGVFAAQPIRKDELIWRFHPDLDRRIDEKLIPLIPRLQYHYVLKACFVNPKRRDRLILCLDEAAYMNFDNPANTKLGDVYEGEFDLLAARDIAQGDEITVPPESDDDYRRKMEASS